MCDCECCIFLFCQVFVWNYFKKTTKSDRQNNHGFNRITSLLAILTKVPPPAVGTSRLFRNDLHGRTVRICDNLTQLQKGKARSRVFSRSFHAPPLSSLSVHHPSRAMAKLSSKSVPPGASERLFPSSSPSSESPGLLEIHLFSAISRGEFVGLISVFSCLRVSWSQSVHVLIRIYLYKETKD